MDHTLLAGGGNGQSGTDFVTTLNWKNVVLAPAEWQKIHENGQGKPAGALGHRFAVRKG
jgi:hypothetical protein